MPCRSSEPPQPALRICWCTCGKARTCIGCKIELAAKNLYGEPGAQHLQRFIERAEHCEHQGEHICAAGHARIRFYEGTQCPMCFMLEVLKVRNILLNELY